MRKTRLLLAVLLVLIWSQLARATVTVLESYGDATQAGGSATLTADADTGSAITLGQGYSHGGAFATRSGSSAYVCAIQYSVNGTTWLTLGTLTDACPFSTFVSQTVSSARYVRYNCTTVNSQTITLHFRLVH